MYRSDKLELNDDYTKLKNLIILLTEKHEVLKTKIVNKPQTKRINRNVVSEINERNLMLTELTNKLPTKYPSI